MSRAAVVVADDLHKSFPGRKGLGRLAPVHAVRGVSFRISEGETLGLVGESGSGKSTVANMVTGLVRPSAGRVMFGAVDLASLRGRALRSHRRNVQVVMQDPYGSFEPTITLGASIAEPLDAHRIGDRPTRRRRVRELLERVGLGGDFADRRPAEMSGGQLQRASIARALAVDPKLLVLDEPVSALDVSTKAEIINLLVDLRAQLGLALLFISHDLGTLRVITDSLAVMYLGEIVEQGPSEVIYTAPRHPYTRALLDAVPVADPVVQRARTRTRLAGEIPSIESLPTGCSFHPRCPQAMPECAVSPPPSVAVDEVVVTCHLYGSEGSSAG